MLSWEMLWPIGTVLLAAGLVYGLVSYYRRDKRNDRITEQATHEEYNNPNYGEARREELKAQVREH
jgi:hypothetical protein